MNELNPLLKKVLAVVHKVEQSDLDASTEPPRHLVASVLREATRSSAFEMSLLERMVQRAAAVCAAVGVLAISLQLLPGGASLGMFQNALSHGALLVRAFLP